MKNSKAGKVLLIIVPALIVVLIASVILVLVIRSDNTEIHDKIVSKTTENGSAKLKDEDAITLDFVPDISDEKITKDDLDAAKRVLEARLKSRKLSPYEISVDYGTHHIFVRISRESFKSDTDIRHTANELSATGMLIFCRGRDTDDVIMDGSMVKKAAAGVDDRGNYFVSLAFTEEGKRLFADATTELIGQQVSIWLDDTIKVVATVQEPITAGQAQIPMGSNATEEDAKTLADTISTGSLPFAMRVSVSGFDY